MYYLNKQTLSKPAYVVKLVVERTQNLEKLEGNFRSSAKTVDKEKCLISDTYRNVDLDGPL